MLTVFLLARPLFAAYTDIELFVPIAGRGHQSGGRVFETTLWLTNSGSVAAHVRVQFLHSAQPNPSPREIDFTLGAGDTRVFDPIGVEILGEEQAVGAIRIRSDVPILGTARTMSRIESDSAGRSVSTTLNAIPARFAIGNGQSAIAQGITLADAAHRLYVVETAGQSLTYIVAILDVHGKTLAQKTFYVAPMEQRIIDLGAEFPNVQTDHGVADVRGINGNGRIIFTAVQIARDSQDGSAYEMSYANEPRVRMPTAEVVAYVAVACAIIVAGLLYRR